MDRIWQTPCALCAGKAVPVSVDLLEEDLALSDSDSDSDDDLTDDVSIWSHESVVASFLAVTSGYSSDSESDSEDTVVARRKSATLPRRLESKEIVSDDELSDDEGCDFTDKRRRRRRRYNRLEKERTDFTQSSSKGSLSPESGSSEENSSSSESESSDSSSSDSDSDDLTSGSSSESDSDSDESSSGSSSDSDSRSCSSSSSSSSSSDDSDFGIDGDDAREIDLKFDRNPCPATCVCLSGSNMFQIPTARRRRTEQSLYNEVLNRQLLKSYNAAREIDLQFEENPCPKTCVCRSSRNMLQVRRAHRRETEPPLYQMVLSRRLLRPSNRIVHDCCKYRCSRSWQRPGRPDLD
ncbi:clumping factor A-like [Dreissena polymorpha]|uniref:clumping factor A-like n=1 Tax=Dreissena polymorpha TaxID=45954 RepID=UPI002263E22B|nr:clumping factor A-like [Dreissena polymorpha]